MKAEKRRRELDRAWRNDFTAFAAHLDIIPKETGGRQKLRPNAIQAAFEVSRTGRDIVLKPRQVGLTTWELARDIWFFLTRPNAKVVVVCQSMADDSAIKEISDKLSVMFESLRDMGITNVVEESTTKWTLRGSDASLRIIGAGASEAAAKKKGRSGTIHRLHVTEAAFFEFAQATMNAILECVPNGAHTEIVIESTANGASGWFYDQYQDAKAGRGSYKAQFFEWLKQSEYSLSLEPGEVVTPSTSRERAIVKAGATPEQLKWYRQKVVDKKDQDLVDQEYPVDEDTCWITAGRLFFDKEQTKLNHATAIPPIETREVGREGSKGVFRIWKHREPGRRYVIIIDPSEGVGGDPTAAVVLDRGTGEHVATIHGQFATWECARVCAEVGKMYWGAQPDGSRLPALIVVERNNHGHAVLQGLVREQKYPHIYADRDKRAGWKNTEPSRASVLGGLQQALVDKHWSSPEKESHGEMLKFVVLENGRAEAAKGAHDDLVLAHAIGWDIVCRPSIDRYVPPGIAA